MPRNVRNFWVELEVDGKKEKVATGPRGKDGGFYLTVKARTVEGQVSAPQVTVRGFVNPQGNLELEVTRGYLGMVHLKG